MSQLLCSKCRNGVMVERSGKFGNFLGCSNYPKCKNTEKIRYVKVEPVKRDFSNFKPSKYQLAIKEYFTANKGNVLVNATAGSGKSTTIEYIAQYLNGDILVLAFNRAIAKELQSRLPNASVKTLHSFGLQLIKSNSGIARPKIDDSKVFNYLKNSHLDINATKEDKQQFYSVAIPSSKLVSLVQSFGVKNPTIDDLIELAMVADLDINESVSGIVYNWTIDALRYTRQTFDTLSFGDMIDIPYVYGYKTQPFDYILVDESQDLNIAQMEIIFNQSTINTRVMFVGDRNQAIYEWRGSDSNSMDNIANLFDCALFPLPVTYRNSKAIVKHINEKLPYIEHIARDNAHEGIEPKNITLDDFYKLVKPADMVISRTNAQMIKPVWQLIRQGIKATIAGKEIGQDLIKLILKFKHNSIEQTITALEDHSIEKVNKLNASGKFSTAEMVKDKISTAIQILTEFNSLENAIDFIEKVFSDNNTGIVFATIHKAKGLESEDVYILQTNSELPIADNNENGDQELNVTFVAMSRAKNTFYYVTE